MRTSTTKITVTMKAWRLDRLGGELRFESVPMPEIRPGSILVRVEASTLMSYIKSYVEGRLPSHHAPGADLLPAAIGLALSRPWARTCGNWCRDGAWFFRRSSAHRRTSLIPRKF